MKQKELVKGEEHSKSKKISMLISEAQFQSLANNLVNLKKVNNNISFKLIQNESK